MILIKCYNNFKLIAIDKCVIYLKMDEKVISFFASGKATTLRNHLILFSITFKDSIIFSIISYSYKLKIKQFLPQPSAVGLCPFLLPEEVLIVF